MKKRTAQLRNRDFGRSSDHGNQEQAEYNRPDPREYVDAPTDFDLRQVPKTQSRWGECGCHEELVLIYHFRRRLFTDEIHYQKSRFPEPPF